MCCYFNYDLNLERNLWGLRCKNYKKLRCTRNATVIIIIVYLVSVQNQPQHKLFSLRQTLNHVLFDVPSKEGKDGTKKKKLIKMKISKHDYIQAINNTNYEQQRTRTRVEKIQPVCSGRNV